MKTYTVYINSTLWSCESNLVGCSKIYHYLLSNNHKITKDPSKADYIIINSCGVVQDTINKTIQLYNQYYSKKKKSASIIIYGCLVKIDNDLVKTLDVYPISFEENSKLDSFFFNNSKFEDLMPYCDNKTKDILIFEKHPFEFLQSRNFRTT